MLKLKKLLAITVVMAITAISSLTIAQAKDYDTSINADITTYYSDNGQNLVVRVSTSEKVGAIKATLNYNTNDLTYVNSDKLPTDHTEGDSVKASEGAVTFVFVTDDIQNGSTAWADFYFIVKNDATTEFQLDPIETCSVNEEFFTTNITPITRLVSVSTLVTLGAQIRTTDNALRFGSRIDFNDKVGNILKNGGTITNRGYLIAFKENLIVDNNLFLMECKNSDGTGKNKSCILNKVAPKTYLEKTDYLIYTMVITNIKDTSREIAIRPYIVYTDNGISKVLYGEQIYKSIAGVEEELYK